MRIGVIATFIAKPEFEQDVEQALRKIVAPSRIDDGCEDYALYRDQKNTQRFYILERWNDEEVLELHQKQEHFKELLAALDGKLESLDVQTLDALQ